MVGREKQEKREAREQREAEWKPFPMYIVKTHTCGESKICTVVLKI